MATARKIFDRASALGYAPNRWDVEQIQSRYRLLGVMGNDSTRLDAAIQTYYNPLQR